jgi:hypothetical protein
VIERVSDIRMLVFVELEDESMIGSESLFSVVVLQQKGESPPHLHLDLVAVMVFLILLGTEHLSKHVDPFLEAFYRIRILAEVEICQPHSIESLCDDCVLIFGFERYNFDLFF